MLTFLYQYVRKKTNASSLAVLAILFVGCIVGFYFRAVELGPPPDRLLWFDAQTIKEFLCQPNKPNGRYLFAATQATLAVVFPFTYCTLFGILIAALFKQKTATRLLILPLLAFIGDLSENAVSIYVALTFDCHLAPPTIPWLASTLTPTKWFFIAATVLTIITGLIGRLASKKA